MNLNKYILSFVCLLFLSGCKYLMAEYWFYGDKSKFSPWHGFVYVLEQPGVEARVYKGAYKTLTNCMEVMQAQTKYNGYAYFCGFNCPTPEDNSKALKCEKVMGSPLELLP